MGLFYGLMEVLGRQNDKLMSFDNDDDKTKDRLRDENCNDTTSKLDSSPTLSLWCQSLSQDSSTSDIASRTFQPYSVEVHAVHFDHQQRGLESDGDRLFVHDLCAHYRIPLTCYYWNQDHHHNAATDASHFSQDSARKWRQDRMEALLRGLVVSNKSKTCRPRVGMILTAHHKDDSMESLLLKLLRGVHITNLQGMETVVRRRYRHENSQLHETPRNQQYNGNADDTALEKDNTGKDSEEDREKEMMSFLWYARPLLSVSKEEIMGFLRQRGHSWREDSSNQSNKYLRNRVRNELVPLMSTLGGGKQNLYRRLEHLSRQSQQVQKHLNKESLVYRQRQGMSPSTIDGIFQLPKAFVDTSGQTSEIDSLVFQHALYDWIQETISSRHEGAGFQISFERVQNVYHQLRAYSKKQQWRLNVGEGWDVERQGSILCMVKTQSIGDNSTIRSDADKVSLEWRICKRDNDARVPSSEIDAKNRGHNLRISVPIAWINCDRPLGRVARLSLDFVLTTLEAIREDSSALFRAPWWPEDRRPVRVNVFLRGQKIALHQRSQAPIILAVRNDPVASRDHQQRNISVVAIFVETKGKWIVHRDFLVEAYNDTETISDHYSMPDTDREIIELEIAS